MCYNGDMKRNLIFLLFGFTLGACVLVKLMTGGSREDAEPAVDESVASMVEEDDACVAADSEEPVEEATDDESGEGLSEEEKAEAEEEKLVEAFDELTDKWLEATPSGVKMADIDAFVRQFKSVPKARQDECLHRALNLIPDENVMLLAGILLDKSIDKELVELVYNDVLNRDEDVKKPILQEIFKDKEHPCWADTAWILDVTGELPKKE